MLVSIFLMKPQLSSAARIFFNDLPQVEGKMYVHFSLEGHTFMFEEKFSF